MGFTTEIGWCDSTHNHWIGCSKISRGCRWCYAEVFERRYRPARDGRRTAAVWGRRAERRLTTRQNRRKPYAWNRLAAQTRQPLRVFSASLADVFEDHWMLPEWRADLFHLIEETPWLRWMLLTKRIELVAEMTAEAWGTDWPTNVWLGTSVEGQPEADKRLPHLLNIEGPTERFASVEPLLQSTKVGAHLDAGRFPLSLLIVGGESGAKARPMHPAWAASLVEEAEQHEVPLFFKQWGEFSPYQPADTPDRRPSLHVRSIDGDVVRYPHRPGSGSDWQPMWRVGKNNAGRVLNGRTYDGVVRSWAAEMAAAGHELVTV
jgi:protein gp37